MKLSPGARTGLWALVAGYATYTALWVGLPRPYESLVSKVLVFAVASTVTMLVFVLVERRLPNLRSREPHLSGWRVALLFGAIVLWFLVLPTFLPPSPDSTRYYEAKFAILYAAAFLMGWVTALMPPPPAPGSRRSQIGARVARVGRLIDEGRWSDVDSSAPEAPDIPRQ